MLAFRRETNYNNNNPLGAIIKNVRLSVFCAVKRNKKGLSATGRYRKPFLIKFFLFSILFRLEAGSLELPENHHQN